MIKQDAINYSEHKQKIDKDIEYLGIEPEKRKDA